MERIVDSLDTGLPLSEWLQRQFPAAPAGYLRQLLRKGRILADGRVAEADLPTRRGMRVRLPDSRRLREIAELAPALSILRETDDWLAVNKPAGLAVHRTAGVDTDLTSLLRQLVRRRGDRYRLSPVHRLDRGTSGVILFAKGHQAAGRLGKSLMAGLWRKTYLALAAGLAPPGGTLDQPLPIRGKIRPSRARFRRLASRNGQSLLLLELETGRTHQLRRQLAAAGWPILGDRRYGVDAPPLPPRPFLHCLRIELEDGQTLTAPLPRELRDGLRQWLASPDDGKGTGPTA
ncbi:RluA family pseudouridine synthase [Geothermobacter ehrlichii]|nr:RluA family pseudouridine synthase [Geothermobacter ehrlichii]